MTTKANPAPDLTFDCLVHDLNNVFQTIIDAADLVSTDPSWSSIAGILMRSVEQGRRIVASIAEKDHGSVPFDLIAGHAMQFATDVVTAMKGPTLEFTSEIPPGLHPRLAAAALERVLVNLFINASQAARAAGRPRCQIAVTAWDQDARIHVQIADDGPGIPVEVLPLIFTPRFSTDGQRTGLGLHIVQSLVASAGGAVSAANGTTGGAVFRIELPQI